MSDELPQGWAEVSLEEVGEIVTGNTPPKNNAANYGDKYPWVKPPDLDSGTPITTTTDFLSETGAQLARLLPEGTTLVSCIGFLGKVGYAGTTLATNQQINSVVFDKRLVEPRYGYHYCKTLRRWLEDNSSSTTVAIINKGRFSQAPIRLAPLAEQRRIVAKLEALLGQVDACRQRLEKIPTLLKRFRQSVLAAACSGRLTEDWRGENRIVQPASEVSATAKLADDMPEIPESWRWVKLPDTGDMTRGKSRHRPRNEPSLLGGPYPFIQTGDIAQSGGRITNHKQTYSEAGLAQSRLWPTGTICITIAANIAESAILTYPACFPDSVVGIIANAETSVAEYVEFFIRVAKADLATFAPATAQKNINVGILNEVQVPLPPLAEQQEIVRRVERLFTLADNIEQRYKKAQAFIDKLTPSLLAKAFRGELVPQDPNDEPASVLLERIKAEREKNKPQSRKKR